MPILIFLQEKGITGVHFHLLLCSLQLIWAGKSSQIIRQCARMQQKQEVLAELLLGAESCRAQTKGPPQALPCSIHRAQEGLCCWGFSSGEEFLGWKDTFPGKTAALVPGVEDSGVRGGHWEAVLDLASSLLCHSPALGLLLAPPSPWDHWEAWKGWLHGWIAS